MSFSSGHVLRKYARIVTGLSFSRYSKQSKYSELLDGLEKAGALQDGVQVKKKKKKYFMSRSGSETADCLFRHRLLYMVVGYLGIHESTLTSAHLES